MLCVTGVYLRDITNTFTSVLWLSVSHLNILLLLFWYCYLLSLLSCSSFFLFLLNTCTHNPFLLLFPPRWGNVDVGSKDPSVENSWLKGSPFKVWSGSEEPMPSLFARDFFLELISTFTFHSFSLFSKHLPSFSCLSCS